MVSQCLIQNTKNLFLLYNINVKIYMVCQCLIYKILRKKQSEKKQHSEIEVIEISRMVFSLLLFSGKERTSALSTEAKLPSGLEILRFGRDLSWNFIRKKQEGESPSPWCMFLQQVLFFLRYFFFLKGSSGNLRAKSHAADLERSWVCLESCRLNFTSLMERWRPCIPSGRKSVGAATYHESGDLEAIQDIQDANS